MEELQTLRQRIDQADGDLVRAFTQRMEAALQIARYKRDNNLPVRDPAREREVINRRTAGMDDEMALYIKLLYNTLFDISRSYQARHMPGKGGLSARVAQALHQTPRVSPPRGGGLPGRGRRLQPTGLRQAVRPAGDHVLQTV